MSKNSKVEKNQRIVNMPFSSKYQLNKGGTTYRENTKTKSISFVKEKGLRTTESMKRFKGFEGSSSSLSKPEVTIREVAIKPASSREKLGRTRPVSSYSPQMNEKIQKQNSK